MQLKWSWTVIQIRFMKIIKSFRKTISLKIDETWEIIIKAPLFVSNKRIQDFVDKHKEWIEEKRQVVIGRVKVYVEWEKFMYFWGEYELKFLWWLKDITFDWINFYIDESNQNRSKLLFTNFYKKESKNYIEKRLQFIANKYDLKYNKLRISSAKTRWWSCSSTKNLSFSYRLIMAPVETIDYVIVHELAHLKEMNHSNNFWNLVEKMISWLDLWDYKVHKNWLKLHWNKLIF